MNMSLKSFLVSKIKVIGSAMLIILVFSVPGRSEKQQGAGEMQLTKDRVNYGVVRFSQLFFHYKPPMDVEHPDGNITKGTKTPMEIPAAIKTMSGQKVAIKGFVIPLANAEGRINEFLFADELVSCMFCAMMGYDQWILVNTKDPKGFKFSDDDFEEPVLLYGTLEVGPFFEDGQLVALYQFRADGFESQRKKLFGVF